MPSVITANHLRSGAVLYLGPDGRWVEDLANAKVATTPEDLKPLEALALAAVERTEVTAVYAFDVRIEGGIPMPVSVREKIRAARGPSV